MKTHPTQCPECGSSDVRFDPQHGDAFCKACKHDWSIEPLPERNEAAAAALAPLKIFLSYGHDEHVADAERIKADLEARGHRVWFDAERLRPGRDWEQYIEEGLRDCDKVVLLMTPHSIRRPAGYCLNEIAKAIERNKLIIPVLLVELTEGPPTSICRIQYLDLRDAVPTIEHLERYGQKFDRLVLAIEEDALDFEGGQARLNRLLRPLNFDAQISPHVAHFTGREWLFRELDDWLEHRPESRVFWIVGGPGIGKSAIAAWLCHHRRNLIASHFCVHGHDDKSDPRRVVLSLAYQLAAHLPNYQRKLQDLPLEEEQAKNAKTLFDNLLIGPLTAPDFSPPQGNQLVVIDAIDEATRSGGNEVADFIAQYWRQTPAWLRLVITSRPEAEVITRLKRSDLQPHFLDARSQENQTDLREHLRRELQKREISCNAKVLDAILKKSEGIFLYVATVLDELLQGHLSVDRLDELPEGMAGYYQRIFSRQFPDTANYEACLLPLLNPLIAQREPLPLDLLAAAAGLNDFELRQRLAVLGALFPVQSARSNHGPRQTIIPFHKSVADWLTAHDEQTGMMLAGPHAVDRQAGEQSLARACWNDYRKADRNLSAYVLAQLPAHLIAAQHWDELEAVLTDLRFLEAKILAGLAFELTADFAHAVAALPKNRGQRRLLKLLEEALRRDIHFISQHAEDYPQALFQCLWNTGWWYDCPEAAQHYVEPEAGWRDPPPWRQPGPKLSELLERWKTQKESAPAYYPWLQSRRPPPVSLGGPQQAVIRHHEGWVTSIVQLGASFRAASGSLDRSVRIWNLETGAEVIRFSGHDGGVTSIAASCGNSYIASGDADGNVIVWDTTSAMLRCRLPRQDSSITSVAFLSNGVLLTTTYHGDVSLWNWEHPTLLQRVRIDAGVRSAKTFVAGHLFVLGCGDGLVRMWNSGPFEEMAVFKSKGTEVTSIACSSDEQQIAVGYADGSIDVWNLRNRSQRIELRGHEKEVATLSFSPNTRWLASGSHDTTVRLWNLVDDSSSRAFYGHDGLVLGVDFTSEGNHLVSASADRTVRVWEVLNPSNLPAPEPHGQAIIVANYSPDGMAILTAAADQTIKLWDAECGVSRWSRRLSSNAYCTAFSPDGAEFAIGLSDGHVWTFDVVNGDYAVSYEGDGTAVFCLGYSLDGLRLAGGRADGSLLILDRGQPPTVLTIGKEFGPIHKTALSQNGGVAAIWSADKHVRVIDIANADMVWTSTERIQRLTTIELSINGARVSVGGYEGRVTCWERNADNSETCVSQSHSEFTVSYDESSRDTAIRCHGHPLVRYPITPYIYARRPGAREWAIGQGGQLYILRLVPQDTAR